MLANPAPTTQSAKSVEDRHQVIAAVQENQLREARKVWNRLVIRGKIAGAGEPANVRPDKAALCRRMLVFLLIRMLVMMPMRRCPPKRTSLHRSVSQNCEQELDWA